MLLLVLYVVGALAISFLCSILEAALLSVRIIELTRRKQDGDSAAAALLDLKERRIDDAISAILTLNTIAHTIGATLAGAQAAKVFGDAWVGVFSAVLTLLVLIVTEIIPKTLGTAYASGLVGFVARTLKMLMTGLTPVLWATGLITRLVGRPSHHQVSRAELLAVVSMASRHGALEGHEEQALENLLKLDDILLEDVMTPRVVCAMLPSTATADELLADEKVRSFSRVPLYEGTQDRVIGYVHQQEVLGALARGEGGAAPLMQFRRAVTHVPESTPLARALRDLLERREHMVVVTDEHGGTSGLATLEDILETVLGTEIVDELDHHVDLRALAARQRDRRLVQRGYTTPETGAPDTPTDPEP